MAEYIDREKLLGLYVDGKYDTADYRVPVPVIIQNIKDIPAADVVSRDEGIKIGAELAAMHEATPTEQALEKAYFDGLEYGMKRRDVRPVVRGRWVTPTIINGRAFNIPHCSACDGVPCGVDEHTNFCPNCGADMREES